MSFKISEKELKILFIVAIAAIVALAFWGNKRLSAGNEQTEAKISELNTRYDDLKSKNAQKKKYTSDTEKYTDMYANILKKYGNGLDQEHMIMTLKAAEEETGAWINQVTLAGVSSIYTFGNVTSTNPAYLGQKVYMSDLIGVNSVLNIGFEGTYDQIKDLIKYINTNESKAVINNVAMTYSGAIVTGTMQLKLHGIVGSEREYADLVLKNVALGTDNIFNSSTFENSLGDADYGDKIKNDYDVFLMLNAKDSDMDSVSIGLRNDIDGSKTLTENSNGIEKVSIRITGEKGAYRISYRIGNTAYPEDDYITGAEFTCGETLDLLIIGSKRIDTNDNAGAKLTIINSSDLVLNYKVINDDPVEPRFTLEKSTGLVMEY